MILHVVYITSICNVKNEKVYNKASYKKKDNVKKFPIILY